MPLRGSLGRHYIGRGGVGGKEMPHQRSASSSYVHRRIKPTQNRRRDTLLGFQGGAGGRLQKAAAIEQNRAPTGPRLGPTDPTFFPLRLSFLRVSSRPFLSLMTMFFVVDEFHGKYALESLISAFLKFKLENIEYAKLMEIVR